METGWKRCPVQVQYTGMVSSWSQFATLNNDEEKSQTRRLGTGGTFDSRGADEKVILDADLGRIYGVEIKAFNRGEAQRRPLSARFRFPAFPEGICFFKVPIGRNLTHAP